jgi:hypothetical protein
VRYRLRLALADGIESAGSSAVHTALPAARFFLLRDGPAILVWPRCSASPAGCCCAGRNER